MTAARRVALDALDRIETDAAFANLLLPQLLGRSDLAVRDRAFVTDLVYGTTRMRRACDLVIDRFLAKPPSRRVRNALRLGAYQIVFGGIPVHAAVAETVAVTPKPARGLVNAVLRRVASEPVDWPDEPSRLSVPDWIYERLVADLGGVDAVAALETMNRAPAVTVRDDGYVQDLGSQEVARAVAAGPGDLVLDACAAPGGKATALAAAGARVVAADVRESRVGLIRTNLQRLGLAMGSADAEHPPAGAVALAVADASRPPWRSASFDTVLLDAPCSGLGTLHRRADLRWRVEPESVERLAALQLRLVDAAVDLVRPGGTVVYSVCTLTAAESTGVDDHVAATHPDLVPLPPPSEPWQPWGRGAILLPQTAGTDGMCLFRYTRDNSRSVVN